MSHILAVVIRRRAGQPIFPRALLPTTAIAGTFATATWPVHQVVEPTARGEAFAFVAAVGVVAGAIYLVIWRRIHRGLRELRADRPLELDDPDLALEG